MAAEGQKFKSLRRAFRANGIKREINTTVIRDFHDSPGDIAAVIDNMISAQLANICFMLH